MSFTNSGAELERTSCGLSDIWTSPSTWFSSSCCSCQLLHVLLSAGWSVLLRNVPAQHEKPSAMRVAASGRTVGAGCLEGDPPCVGSGRVLQQRSCLPAQPTLLYLLALLQVVIKHRKALTGLALSSSSKALRLAALACGACCLKARRPQTRL